MPLALEKKLPIILFLAFLLLAAIGYFSYQSTKSLKKAVEWQKHTQDVLVKLDETMVAALDVETSGRGFLLTGTDTFLEPFAKGKQNALKSLEELKNLTEDNKKQDENFTQLAKQVNDKIKVTEKYVEVRRNSGLLGGVNEISKGEGENVMSQIRLIIERMKNEEMSLLKLRQENLDATLNSNFWMMIVSSFAGVIALGIANFAVLFEIKKRQLAEANLLEVNQDLEKRVEERTEALEKANLQVLERADENERLLQNEQVARGEAEIANRLRDEFMATISHELRTPLNAILGWARIMSTGKIEPEKYSKAIETIIKNAETQNRLIEDLMDVARVISGKLVLDIEKVNPEELVTTSVETIKPIAEEKSIEVALKIGKMVKDQSLAGDPNRLRQILLNLLTNAVKFTPEGGKIDVSLAQKDNRFVFKIKDNGVGINPEFLPFVFERFRQDAANIEKSGGLGLGLAIVRHLTELHGGSVSVESKGQDKGATFTVSFPFASEKE